MTNHEKPVTVQEAAAVESNPISDAKVPSINCAATAQPSSPPTDFGSDFTQLFEIEIAILRGFAFRRFPDCETVSLAIRQ